MSINDFSNKIKGKLDIDSSTITCLFILVLVAVSSFGLGRLSIGNTSDKSDNESIEIVKSEVGKSGEENMIVDSSEPKEKMYIASKNGKLYYGINCSGAKRISSKNAVWFGSKDDAEKAGYTASSTCK